MHIDSNSSSVPHVCSYAINGDQQCITYCRRWFNISTCIIFIGLTFINSTSLHLSLVGNHSTISQKWSSFWPWLPLLVAIPEHQYKILYESLERAERIKVSLNEAKDIKILASSFIFIYHCFSCKFSSISIGLVAIL